MRIRGIDFTFQIEKECTLLFSETHLEYIFNNFIMNAMRYTREEKRIQVTLKKEKQGYVLSVYIDGRNIPEDQMEKIWEEFYSQEKQETDSTGLGLFIVKEIAKIYHMDCGVKNHKDGVEFWFVFSEKEMIEGGVL